MDQNFMLYFTKRKREKEVDIEDGHEHFMDLQCTDPTGARGRECSLHDLLIQFALS